VKNWTNKISDLNFPRRLIGRRFDDPIVKKDVESWPFKVVDQGTSPAVEVEYLGENKTFTPQEISSMVLMKASFPHNLGSNSIPTRPQFTNKSNR